MKYEVCGSQSRILSFSQRSTARGNLPVRASKPITHSQFCIYSCLVVTGNGPWGPVCCRRNPQCSFSLPLFCIDALHTMRCYKRRSIKAWDNNSPILSLTTAGSPLREYCMLWGSTRRSARSILSRLPGCLWVSSKPWQIRSWHKSKERKRGVRLGNRG